VHDATELERLARVRQDFVATVSRELLPRLTALRRYTQTELTCAAEDPGRNLNCRGRINAHATRLNYLASALCVLS